MLYWVTAYEDIQKWYEFNAETATEESLEKTFQIKLLDYESAQEIATQNYNSDRNDKYFIIKVHLKNPNQALKYVPYPLSKKTNEIIDAVQILAWEVHKPTMGEPEIKNAIAAALKMAEETKIRFDQQLIIRKLHEEINKLQGKLNTINSNNLHELDTLRAAQVLEKQLLSNKYQLTIDQQQSTIQELNTDLNKIKEELRKYSINYNTLYNDLNKANSELNFVKQVLNRKINDLKKEVESEKQKFKDEKDVLIHQYDTAASETQLTITGLSAQLDEANLKIETLKTSNQEEIDKASALAEEINKLKAKMEADREAFDIEKKNTIAQHQESITSKQSQIDALNRELNTISLNAYCEIERIKNTHQQEIDDISLEKEKYVKNENELNITIKNLNFELITLKESFSILETNNFILTGEIQKLNEAKQTLETRVNTLLREKDNLIQQFYVAVKANAKVTREKLTGQNPDVSNVDNLSSPSVPVESISSKNLEKALNININLPFEKEDTGSVVHDTLNATYEESKTYKKPNNVFHLDLPNSMPYTTNYQTEKSVEITTTTKEQENKESETTVTKFLISVPPNAMPANTTNIQNNEKTFVFTKDTTEQEVTEKHTTVLAPENEKKITNKIKSVKTKQSLDIKDVAQWGGSIAAGMLTFYYGGIEGTVNKHLIPLGVTLGTYFFAKVGELGLNKFYKNSNKIKSKEKILGQDQNISVQQLNKALVSDPTNNPKNTEEVYITGNVISVTKQFTRHKEQTNENVEQTVIEQTQRTKEKIGKIVKK